MTVSNLVFFIICTICVLGLIFIPAYYIFAVYCEDLTTYSRSDWYNYIGLYMLIFATGSLVELLILFLLALIMGMNSYALSFFDEYLKSSVFHLVFSTFLIFTFIFVYITINKKSSIDLIRLKNSYFKLQGLENAKKKVENSLKDIETEILNNKEKEHVVEELEKNKKYLQIESENYTIKIKQLEQYRIKIILRLREKGYKNIKYD